VGGRGRGQAGQGTCRGHLEVQVDAWFSLSCWSSFRRRSLRASWTSCTPSRKCWWACRAPWTTWRRTQSASRSEYQGPLWMKPHAVSQEVSSSSSSSSSSCSTVNWTVPFLSWLAMAALCSASVLLYLVPLRYLVLAWGEYYWVLQSTTEDCWVQHNTQKVPSSSVGVNKFTKKLRDPFLIDNNELLDFLSRVPSDVQVVGRGRERGREGEGG